MSPTTPRRRIARRSTVGTALTAVVALVGSVLLGVATALPAQAHEGHGHVLIFTEDAAGDWHDAAIAQATPKVQGGARGGGHGRHGRAQGDGRRLGGGVHRRGPRAVRRDPRLPGQRRPMERLREGGAGALAGGRQRHRGGAQRPRHARQLPLVGQHGRLADARPRAHRHRPRPVRRRAQRGHHPPVHRALHGHRGRDPLDPQRRVVQLQQQRARHRPRAPVHGRVDLLRRQHGLRPPDHLVQALRGRPLLGHRAGPLPLALRRARLHGRARGRREVRRRPRGGRLRRHRVEQLRAHPARPEHLRALRDRRRRRRQGLLHRARPRPAPRMYDPKYPGRHHRAVPPRLLRR